MARRRRVAIGHAEARGAFHRHDPEWIPKSEPSALARCRLEQIQGVDRDESVRLCLVHPVKSIGTCHANTDHAPISVDCWTAAHPSHNAGVRENPTNARDRPKPHNEPRAKNPRVADLIVGVSNKRDVREHGETVGRPAR